MLEVKKEIGGGDCAIGARFPEKSRRTPLDRMKRVVVQHNFVRRLTAPELKLRERDWKATKSKTKGGEIPRLENRLGRRKPFEDVGEDLGLRVDQKNFVVRAALPTLVCLGHTKLNKQSALPAIEKKIPRHQRGQIADPGGRAESKEHQALDFGRGDRTEKTTKRRKRKREGFARRIEGPHVAKTLRQILEERKRRGRRGVRSEARKDPLEM